MAEADNLKTVRDTLIAEREKLGIKVPAAQIGTQGSSAPIDEGMSSALEQLVLLAQLHAGRNEDDITRGYSEGTTSLVRQYMADRGIAIDTIDKLTGSLQALDTVSSGQTKSTFDQQYKPGATDLTMFKIESASLLAGTQRGAAVPAPRSLTELFGDSTRKTEPVVVPTSTVATPVEQTQPAVREMSRSYSYDDIQRIRDKGILSVEETAAVAAFDTIWAKYKSDKGYDDVWNKLQESKGVVNRPYVGYSALTTERTSLVQQNEALLEDLQGRTLTFKVNGETYQRSWNEVYDQVGYWEMNDSAFETQLRREAAKALDALKVESGYDARSQEITGLNTKINTYYSDIYRDNSALQARERTLFADLRNDKMTVNFNVPVVDLPGQRVADVSDVALKTGGGGR